MQLQQSPFGCGPAAVVNALESLGIQTTQEVVATLAKTNPQEGTYPAGMRRALEALGFEPLVIEVKDQDLALAAARGHLMTGRPILLCVDNWEHWVTAIGMLGDRILIVDPADGAVTTSMNSADFLTRWGCFAEKKPFYAIAVAPQG